MEDYGILSLLPPIVAIILAIVTRQVYVSLLLGVFMGYLVIQNWNPWEGFLATIEAFVQVFASASNTRTVLFSALIGALIFMMQRSGGVNGFIKWVEGKLDRTDNQNNKQKIKSKKKVQFWAMLTGVVVFVESNISVLTVGTLYRPLFDKLQLSREKLAYIADSTSAPISILIPFNAWGAFIMGLLIEQGYDHSFSMLMQTIPFNLYAIITIVIVVIVIQYTLDIGPMKVATERVEKTGKIMKDGAVPMISDELTEAPAKEGIPHRAQNMVIPIITMILMMPIMLIYTGWDLAVKDVSDASLLDQCLYAMGQGSGSLSVLVSVIISLCIGYMMYVIQRIFSMNELVDNTLKGISGMMPLALLMVFAFAINTICGELGTGQYVAAQASSWISPALLPCIIFILSSFIAFSTGTSWGTFAIMIAIALPMAEQMDGHVILALAAVLGGGVFGDHCSPISDTTIISSMASATDHIEHVRTQLPYALISGIIAIVGYLILGNIF